MYGATSQGGSMMSAEEHVPAYVREHGPLETPVRVLQLANELALLKQQPGWQRGSRLAKTLAKEGPLAVVLSLIRAGTKVEEHHAAGPVTLHCLEGKLRLHHAGHPLDLVAGEVVVLDAGIPHSHEAITDCAVLLTMTQS
jgi:quercetin dioxygenase-like cupin family protein